MRKAIVLEHISLDGVIQAPGGPEEDPSDGFAYGGWAASYSDDVIGAALRKQMNMPCDGIVRLSAGVCDPTGHAAYFTDALHSLCHRLPAQVISHCVWLYFRFALSFRDIEEM